MPQQQGGQQGNDANEHHAPDDESQAWHNDGCEKCLKCIYSVTGRDGGPDAKDGKNSSAIYGRRADG